MTPEVTVVLPTRDRADLLREAVASVLSQPSPSWELVVVDDASSDGTAAWLSSLDDGRIRNVRLDVHVDRSAARNRGLAEAAAPAVLFLDDDDRLAGGALDRLWRALGETPSAVAAIGAKRAFDGTGHRKRIPHPRVRLVRPVWGDVLAGWMFVSGQVLLRAEAVLAAGGWDEKLAVAEDQDLWLRAIGRDPVVLVPSVVLEQRTRAGGVDASFEEEEIRRPFAATDGPLIDARRHLKRAGRAFDDERFADATKELVTAARRAPPLLTSPVWGPQLALSTAKAAAAAALGPAGPAARHAIKRIRTRLRRNPTEPGVPTTGR